MSFADEVKKAVQEGRINPRRSDLGITLGPDDCEMGVCGNKKQEGSRLCEKCHRRFSIAVDRMVAEVEEEDVKKADWWKNE